MIDFLKDANISDETISIIKDKYSVSDMVALCNNSTECLKTIGLFRKLGIKNIDDLLIYEFDIFLKLTNDIVSIISNYNISSLVDDINNDFINAEKLM